MCSLAFGSQCENDRPAVRERAKVVVADKIYTSASSGIQLPMKRATTESDIEYLAVVKRGNPMDSRMVGM